MKRYDERILHLLLDKYERSLLYKGENQRNQAIAVPVNRKTLPEYFDETSLEYDRIHSQLLEMEERGYVRLVWKAGKTGHILEKCILETETAPEVYALLHRTSKNEKIAQMLDICREFQGKGQILGGFLAWCEERLTKGESLQGYASIEEPEQFRETCYLMHTIENNQEEIFLREFSIKYFHDSKTAEKSIGHAAALLRDFSGNRTMLHGEGSEAMLDVSMTAEEVLEEFHISKNPGWIMMKGCGRFLIASSDPFCPSGQSNAALDISAFPGGIGISSEDIPFIQWDVQVRPMAVITIENLTSFHRWHDPRYLAIYLGGYHNRAKREFLKQLANSFAAGEEGKREVQYFHFGDTDAGGFKIWKNLCIRTGICFKTYRMDLETFRTYAPYGRELTKHDRGELEKMREDPFFEGQRELFTLMLEKDRKIEQECII